MLNEIKSAVFPVSGVIHFMNKHGQQSECTISTAHEFHKLIRYINGKNMFEVCDPSGVGWWRPIHRTDGPAVIMSNGTEIWVKEGKIHREDGPAYIDTRADTITYYIDGKPFDDPGEYIDALVATRSPGDTFSYTDKDGVVESYKVDETGKGYFLHNENGPAIIYPNNDGRERYYLNGVRVDEEEVLTLKIFNTISKSSYHIVVWTDGAIDWQYLPSENTKIILDNNRFYLLDTKTGEHKLIHRPDTFALTNRAVGMYVYICDGRLHRANGPAVIMPNAEPEYWFEGKKYNNQEEIIDLHRGPDGEIFPSYRHLFSNILTATTPVITPPISEPEVIIAPIATNNTEDNGGWGEAAAALIISGIMGAITAANTAIVEQSKRDEIEEPKFY